MLRRGCELSLIHRQPCLVILLVSALFGCGSPSNVSPTTHPSEFLYAATQNGITVFPLNASTGELGFGVLATSVLASSGALANMVSDSAGKFLFACSLYNSTIEGFSINSKSGVLTPISGSTLPLPGFPACDLSIDAAGRFLYIATSTGVLAFTVNATTGALSAIAGSPFSDGSVLRESVMDPSGKFLYAISNTTLNTISVFAINSSSGALTPIAGSPFQLPIGGTAYSIAVHPSGKFLYISFPQTEQIAAWSVNSSTGGLTILPGSPFVSGVVSGDAPNGLVVAPSGEFLYAWSGGASVFGFSVDANSGALSAMTLSPFTLNSENLAIDPTTQFLYAAHGNSVGGFNINVSTGTLTTFASPPVATAGVTLLAVVKVSQ